ncbi:hypothetical protein B0J14DRAFT_658040 [Halenospora varia]|nr:hypothetical protein B0J14DRAFT_658040 [Halenospora varia]
MLSTLCVQCFQAPKDPDHRFCSEWCTLAAANEAPNLLPIPPDNILYHSVETQFRDGWTEGIAPRVKGIYMVTWTQQSQADFYQYRAWVESHGQFKLQGMFAGNERKFFRGTTRACTIGENGNKMMCNIPSCKVCEALRCGFGPYLQLKQATGYNGTRLGAGIYSTPDPSKAIKYADDIFQRSTRVIMLCRVVLGNCYPTKSEKQNFFQPPPGFDSVYGYSGHNSVFKSDERVVYDANAIRPAYLIVL